MRNKVILDTNLLCLLTVGLLGEQWIARHRRLQAYSAADFLLLTRALSNFSEVATTPHILAETSNLLRQTNEPLATSAGLSLAALIRATDEQSFRRSLSSAAPNMRGSGSPIAESSRYSARGTVC